MRFRLALVALALGCSSSVADITPSKNTIASGTDTQGSIFQFGDPVAARELFWQYGACGLSTYFADQVDPGMSLIAMPAIVFDTYGSAQNNALCAKIITMTRAGISRQAVIADRNLSESDSIDMTLDMWESFGGHDNDGTIITGFAWFIEG
jgi:hypothetical protein